LKCGLIFPFQVMRKAQSFTSSRRHTVRTRLYPTTVGTHRHGDAYACAIAVTAAAPSRKGRWFDSRAARAAPPLFSNLVQESARWIPMPIPPSPRLLRRRRCFRRCDTTTAVTNAGGTGGPPGLGSSARARRRRHCRGGGAPPGRAEGGAQSAAARVVRARGMRPITRYPKPKTLNPKP